MSPPPNTFMKSSKKPKSPPKKHLAALCPYCEQPSTFVIDAVSFLPDESPEEEYTFGHCDTCKRVAVFLREDMGEGFDEDTYYRTYPSHDRHIGYYLPEIVRQSYEEAVRCESGKTWIACVVMVGRTLEAVCKEFDPNARSVFEGLKALHTKGIISAEILDWGSELRVLRNVGAHATNQKIEVIDATGALDFLQATLEILYDLRPRFEQFKKRRKAA
jgi:hypothetical protein